MSSGSARKFEDFPEEHEEGGGEETWLVSYADMMTLLFGFFAMLFTYAKFDDGNYVRMKKELARYFGGAYIETAVPRKDIEKDIKAQANRIPMVASSDLKETKAGTEVDFVTLVTFQNGSATLTPDAEVPLKTLADVIRALSAGSKGFPLIKIEGHTDDTPIPPHSRGIFKSNWELSAARAGAIAEFFEKLGFPPQTLSASGYGSTRPAYPNRDANGKPIPENQSRNRRVVIKVILPKDK